MKWRARVLTLVATAGVFCFVLSLLVLQHELMRPERDRGKNTNRNDIRIQLRLDGNRDDNNNNDDKMSDSSRQTRTSEDGAKKEKANESDALRIRVEEKKVDKAAKKTESAKGAGGGEGGGGDGAGDGGGNDEGGADGGAVERGDRLGGGVEVVANARIIKSRKKKEEAERAEAEDENVDVTKEEQIKTFARRQLRLEATERRRSQSTPLLTDAEFQALKIGLDVADSNEESGAGVAPRHSRVPTHILLPPSPSTLLPDAAHGLPLLRKEMRRRFEIRRRRTRRKKGAASSSRATPESTPFERFHAAITRFALYRESDANVDVMLARMASAPVYEARMKSGGTQMKFVLTFSDGATALLKPQRVARDYETPPDAFYFVDLERHHAEIAAFHLDRLLGLRRVPPNVGRMMNMTVDLLEPGDVKMTKKFFTSPAGNLCMTGSCSYYCDTAHAICGKPDGVEASLAVFLPKGEVEPRHVWRHPWRRSYNKHRKAAWETDDAYCERVRATPPYDAGRRLLDLMDMAVFDFLQGNMDRHHYETFQSFGNDTFPIHLDNGRAFGKHHRDEVSILAPIIQCCHIRRSTLQSLVRLHGDRGGDGRAPLSKLSTLMQKSLSTDPLAPILVDGHLKALDRRVRVVLKVVVDCISDFGWANVVLDDGL